jgi:hypothetical protein
MVTAIRSNTQDVEVNGRQFLLEEFTLEQTGMFVDEMFRSVTQEAGPLEDAWKRMAGSMESTFLRILSQPMDGMPVTSEFIAGLRLTQREHLLRIQAKLNHLEDEEFLGNVMAALRALSAWRVAMHGTLGAGNSATASPDTTAATPAKSTQRGPIARLTDLVAGWFGTSGERKNSDETL